MCLDNPNFNNWTIIDEQDEYGNTPLHNLVGRFLLSKSNFSKEGNRLGIINYTKSFIVLFNELVKYSDLRITNNFRFTPYDLALLRNNKFLIDLFSNKNSVSNLENIKYGDTNIKVMYDNLKSKKLKENEINQLFWIANQYFAMMFSDIYGHQCLQYSDFDAPKENPIIIN